MLRRGFTLIEMSVVITILAMMAALIVPNLLAIQRSRAARDAEAALLRLPARARLLAREQGRTVTMRVDGDALVLEAATPGEEARELSRLNLSELSIESAEQAGESIDVASWEWRVYGDGSAEDASLTVRQGKATKTLRLPAEGEPRWTKEGDEDDGASARWSAGEIEQRV